MAKSNVYYSSQHQKVQELLNKLVNYSNTNQQNTSSSSPASPSSIPWKVVVPVLVIGLIVLMAVVIRIKKVAEGRKTKK